MWRQEATPMYGDDKTVFGRAGRHVAGPSVFVKILAGDGGHEGPVGGKGFDRREAVADPRDFPLGEWLPFGASPGDDIDAALALCELFDVGGSEN